MRDVIICSAVTLLLFVEEDSTTVQEGEKRGENVC